MRTPTGRRSRLARFVSAALLLVALSAPAPGTAQERLTFTLATPASQTDLRTVALTEIFAPMVAAFAEYQPGYNGTLFAQGTELEAISRGNLTMAIASAQEPPSISPISRSSPPDTPTRTPPTSSACSTTR